MHKKFLGIVESQPEVIAAKSIRSGQVTWRTQEGREAFLRRVRITKHGGREQIYAVDNNIPKSMRPQDLMKFRVDDKVVSFEMILHESELTELFWKELFDYVESIHNREPFDWSTYDDYHAGRTQKAWEDGLKK